MKIIFLYRDRTLKASANSENYFIEKLLTPNFDIRQFNSQMQESLTVMLHYWSDQC